MIIRTLIVDDEPPARLRLRRWIAGEPGFDVVGECGDGASAVRLIRDRAPDLVFLDIRMPRLDGFGVLRESEGRPAPAIVFTTAFEAHAVEAFEVNAVDYLLKPIDRDRFRRSLERVRRALGPDGRAGDRVALKSGSGVLIVAPDELDRVEAAGNYLRIHRGGRVQLARETMQAVEKRLGPHGFVRVHRSHLVNAARIRAVAPGPGGGIVCSLSTGDDVPVGRRFRSRLEELGG